MHGELQAKRKQAALLHEKAVQKQEKIWEEQESQQRKEFLQYVTCPWIATIHSGNGLIHLPGPMAFCWVRAGGWESVILAISDSIASHHTFHADWLSYKARANSLLLLPPRAVADIECFWTAVAA